MRNSSLWEPSKFALDRRGVLRVPGRTGVIEIGSILSATLIGRWYADVLPQHARGRLLDIGCGKVPLYRLYADRVDEVLGTDWPGSLHGNEFTDFACNLEFGLPLRSECVDTVVASDVLEHLYRPHLMLAEIYRVLRPGGVALVNTPFLYWVHEVPDDYYRYTPSAMRRMASEAGFEVLRLDPLGSAVCVCADIVAKRIRRLRVVGGRLAEGLQRLLLAGLPYLPQSQVYPLHLGAVLRKSSSG